MVITRSVREEDSASILLITFHIHFKTNILFRTEDISESLRSHKNRYNDGGISSRSFINGVVDSWFHYSKPNAEKT